jgi:nitrogen fixation-related uncharacterized protein
MNERAIVVLWLLAACVAFSALPARHAFAQAAPPSAAAEAETRYQTTIEQAVREFGLENWAEARALFRKAHAISPSGRTLRGMGMAAFELKLYVEALRELTAALEATQRPLTPDQRTQVQSLIEQSRAFVGRYHVTLDPAHARPLVDGQDALFEQGNVLLLALGDHLVSATAEGYDELRLGLRVDGGEDVPLHLQLTKTVVAPSEPVVQAAPPVPLVEPQGAAAVVADSSAAPAAADSDAGSGLTTAGFVTLGVAAASGGAALAFWMIGEGQYDDLDACAPSCSDQEISDSGVETSDLLTNVFLGVSAAAAVTSVVLFVLGANAGDDAASETESARVLITPTGAVVRGSF